MFYCYFCQSEIETEAAAMPRSDEPQERILDFIRATHDRTGVFPSVREIAAHMDFRSTNTVDYHLRQLEQRGLIERTARRARSFSLGAAPGSPATTGRARRRAAPTPWLGIPIVGRVAAGQPILAEQNLEGMVNFETMFRTGTETFALRVRGDSMVGAGIHDGDLVIVRQQPRVEAGEIAVAVVGDEATVKRVFDEGDEWRLEPENPAMEPIRVPKRENDFSIAGKVVGVIRKL